MLTKLITANSFKRMPWKNGKGETIELFAIREPLSSELVCRLSIASVTVDGDFSDFSGFQRVLMMIAGGGITLSHQTPEAHIPSQTLTRQYEYCAFNGGWKTEAKLTDGPITDFNVIFDAQRVSAKVSVLKENESNNIGNRSNELFLFAHKEPSTCSWLDGGAPKKIEIPMGCLLLISNKGATELMVNGAGIICVEITTL